MSKEENRQIRQRNLHQDMSIVLSKCSIFDQKDIEYNYFHSTIDFVDINI